MMSRQALLPQKGSYKDKKQSSHTNSSSSPPAKKIFVSTITLDVKNGQGQPSSVPSKTPPTSAVEASTAAAPSKSDYLRKGQGKGPARTVSGGASGNKALNRLPGKTKPHKGSAVCTVPGKKQVQGSDESGDERNGGKETGRATEDTNSLSTCGSRSDACDQVSEDNVSEAADDSGHEGSGDRHMTGSRETGLEGSTTQGTSMKDSGCGSGGQESLKALHDQESGSLDVLKVEPSLENGTGDKVPQREHGEEGSHLCSQRSEVEILQEKLSAAQEVGNEELAEVRTETERALASKDEEIGQLQAQNRELVTKQKDLEAKMEQIVRENGQERVTSVEQAAPPQLPNKEIETLQEELQTKNQQVKQYQRQVDSCKAELDRCRADLKRLQEQESGSLDVLKVEPSLENGTGDEAPQGVARSREGHGEEGSHLCSQRSEVETLQEKLSAAQEVGKRHEEELAEVRTEMERALASKDEEIGQLQAQNRELVTKQKDLEAKMEQIVQESVQGRVSSVEQAAPPQLPNKEVETLQEELQTKNQQVKQYQRQVDAVKAELDRCRADLKRLQEQDNERSESESLVHSKWNEIVEQVKDVLLNKSQEGVELPVGTGEEDKALLEVIREYQERTREKLRSMEERYQHDLTAQEEGSNKKLRAMEERYQHDLTAQEEGSNKKLRAMEERYQHDLAAQEEGSNKKLSAMEVRYQHDLAAQEEGSNKKLGATEEGPGAEPLQSPSIYVQQCSEEGQMPLSVGPEAQANVFPWASHSPLHVPEAVPRNLNSMSSHQPPSLSVITQASSNSLDGNSKMAVGGSQSTVSSCPYVEMIKCRGRGGTHPHLEENMSEASAEQIQDLISQLQNLPAMKAKSGSGNGSVLPRDDTMVAPTPSREGDKVLAGVQSDSQSITHDENVAVCEDVTTGGVAGTESGSEGGANGLESSGRDIGALSPVVMSALLSGEEAGTCGASDPLTPLVVSKGDPVVLLPHPLASPAPKEVLGNPDVSSSREGVLAALNSSDYSVTLQQVEKNRDEAIEKCKDLEKQLQNFKSSNSSLEENLKWQANQMVTLQGELVTQEQKITELNKLLQDALLTSQSVRKELIDEITRISEQSNTALYNAAKKYAEEKEALQAETEAYRTQAAMYNEDFVSERKDRENLNARLLQKEEELATNQKELQSMRQRFEEELQTKNQQVKQYKRQVDAVKADLDKCQMDLSQHKKQLEFEVAKWRDEAKRSQAELQQYKVQAAEFYKGQRGTYEEDRSGSSVDPLQNESERPLHPRAAQLNTPIRPKTENAVMHEMISPSMPSSSPSGQTQGYRAHPHTVQGAPQQWDHMTQPPHPPPDLHSSHPTVQVGRPSHLQSAFMAQHHNAGWSQHEEGPPKRYAPPLASNDFGSNPRPQSLSVYPPDNASQWYGGGGGGNVMQPNQSLYHPRSPFQRPSLHPTQPDLQTRSDAELRASIANQSSNHGSGGGAGIPRQYQTMAASQQMSHEHPHGPSIPVGGSYYRQQRAATNETVRSQDQQFRVGRLPPHQYHEGFLQEGVSDRPAPVGGDEDARGWKPRPDDEHVAEAPFDSNLTCPRCGERFRKGEIQDYKRHVQSHNYPTEVAAD